MRYLKYLCLALVLAAASLVGSYHTAVSDEGDDVEGHSAEMLVERATRGGENVKWPNDRRFRATIDNSATRVAYNKNFTGRDRLPAVAPKVYERIPTTRNVVYLTFDDGPYTNEAPDVAATTDLLDVMKQKGATGTFFFQGIWAWKNYPVVRRVIAEGSNIGNHTCHHPPDGSYLKPCGIPNPPRVKLEKLSPEWQARQVLWGRAAFIYANGNSSRGIMPYFRAPHGSGVVNYPNHPANPNCIKAIAAAGHCVINGDLRLSDARSDLSKTALLRTYQAWFGNGKPGQFRGQILWLHSGLKPTVAALPAILDMLKKQGYSVEALPAGLEKTQMASGSEGPVQAQVRDPILNPLQQ